MKVLITGGSGFLGSHVAEQLGLKGHTVRALVRKSSNTKFLSGLPHVELAYGTVEDKDSVLAAAAGVDAIVHSAGLVKALTAADFDAVNVAGTANLLDAARANRATIKRFVFISSLAAHGPSPDGLPIAADRTPAPVTQYGRSKLAAENLVTAAKSELPVTTIRPPSIYGPRDNEMLAFFEAMAMGMLPIMGGGKQKLSIVHAEDCARACIAAIEVEHESGRAYYVEDGGAYTTNEMADLFLEGTSKKVRRIPVPTAILQVGAFFNESWAKLRRQPRIFTRDKVNELVAPHWVCSSEPIRRELGWKPELGWQEGSRKTDAWYRDAGWIR